MNVLVVPCVTELVLEVQRSLKGVNNVKLFGLASINDYSSTVFDNFYQCSLYAWGSKGLIKK
jgi:hypothetical protein